MSNQYQGFKPSPQKVNPKGKYNEKKWVHIGKRDLIDIDKISAAIYNDIDISSIYAETDNMYKRKDPTKKSNAGRPKKDTYNEEQ